MATASYEDQSTVSASNLFMGRARMGMLNHAQFRVQDPTSNEEQIRLGKEIINNPDHFTPLFTQTIVTQPIVQDGIISSPTDGHDVTDIQILSAVETIYPSFMR